jgi:hypothetical protein
MDACYLATRQRQQRKSVRVPISLCTSVTKHAWPQHRSGKALQRYSVRAAFFFFFAGQKRILYCVRNTLQPFAERTHRFRTPHRFAAPRAWLTAAQNLPALLFHYSLEEMVILSVNNELLFYLNRVVQYWYCTVPVIDTVRIIARSLFYGYYCTWWQLLYCCANTTTIPCYYFRTLCCTVRTDLQ